MYRNALKPGDPVTPGIYWVHHYQHRLAHLCRIALEHFPECAKCGDKVRFTAAEANADPTASWLRLDPDFRETARHIALQPDFGSAAP